ncbi:hypothetical protein MSM1_16365 [Mycobacterium sp. SM1]|uniref:hypothetical protein n=1 Tax=Mycobacterium sp. SM1 TaxID=2816243 RepID=UPI001BCF8468|nr:hypothetical protein [Mycobacterium sp. SM1]MBS4729852.1 hypothetical protein [Mycobacterium sp. SM1]
MLQQTAERPVGSLPAGLRHLCRLAEQLTIVGPGAGRNLRVVVTIPTLRLAGVAATLGSALAPVECRDCEHAKLAPGVRVAGWVSGRLTDSQLVAVSDNELMFGGIRLRGNRDSVHRLPTGFPQRPDTRLLDDVRQELAEALGCAEGVVGQRLSAAAAHPVVVAGRPGTFRADVDLLSAASTSLHLQGRLFAGTDLHDWYRYLVLLMGAIPDREDVPWVATLRPRLVIITGTAGWLASSRRNWPDVPMLVLFSRRSPAAADAAALLKASGWAAPAALPAALRPLLQPTAGLGVLCLTEPATAAVDEDLW